MEYTTALASAPFGVPQNSQFLRPRVNGRIAFLPGCWKSALHRCPGTRKAAASGSDCSVPLLPVCFPFQDGRFSATRNTPPEGAIPCSGGILCNIVVYIRRTCAPQQTACCSTGIQPLPVEPADIHPGFLICHPSKPPFAPISQIADGQLFEIWEYYLIFGRGWAGGWLLGGYG